jgi:general secretion pathway protein M
MTVATAPSLGRVTALSVLALLLLAIGIGPVAGYAGLLGGNSDALAKKTALLQRYRVLAKAEFAAPAPAAPQLTLLYPDMPESQATALLQETVKSTAAAAHVQVQGLQVLRGEPVPGASRIAVRIRASGNIASLRNLIYALETARPLLYPDNLQIQSHAGAPDAAAGSLDFQLDISGFKPEAAS